MSVSSRRSATSGDHNNSGESSDAEHEPLRKSVEEPQPPPRIGYWKDGLWDLFRHGYCHPAVCHSCCCLPLATAQVITRMGFNFWAQPPTVARPAAGVFKSFLKLVISFWIVRVFLLLIIGLNDPNIESVEWIEPDRWYYFFCAVDDLLAVTYFLVSVYILRNLRNAVRQRHSIPEGDSCPRGCEDTCCSIFCSCFVAGQLLRHTADYDSIPGRCCTETGLPPGAAGSTSSSSTSVELV